MTEQEYEQLKIFINDLLYDKLTTDDYYIIMDRLGATHRGNRFSAICHETNSTKHNLSFDSESKCFYCFSGCNCSYSLLSLVKKHRELINENSKTIPSLKWICEQLNIPFDFKDTAQTSNTNRYNWKLNLSKYIKGNSKLNELPTYNKSEVNQFPQLYHTDWLDYGISLDTMEKYNIRYYPYRSQIVIPCYTHNGNLCGIRIRNMNTESDMPKYMPLETLDGKQYKFATNLCFYGENFNSELISKKGIAMLVESEKTVMKYDTWFPNNNICLGLFGSAIGSEQVKYLIKLQVETIIIALDSDFKTIEYSNDNEPDTDYEKFEKKVIKIYKQLRPYFTNIYVLYNNLGFDNCYKFSPTDYTIEQFNQLWDSKERIELAYD